MSGRGLVLAVAAAALAGASALAAPCGSLGPACRAAEVIALARVVSGPDEFDLLTVEVERTVRSESAAPASRLLVRTPRGQGDRAVVSLGERALFFLVDDPLARGLGALAPIDPEWGVLKLSGSSDNGDALLRAVALELDPPPVELAAPLHLALLDSRGPASCAAAEWLAADPARARALGTEGSARLVTVLEARRLPPSAAAALIEAIAAAAPRGAAGALVDFVATLPEPEVTAAVARHLPALADLFTPDQLRAALQRCSDEALPSVLALAAALGDPALLPDVQIHAGAARALVRDAARAAAAALSRPAASAGGQPEDAPQEPAHGPPGTIPRERPAG